jgi:hypothetical protein
MVINIDRFTADMFVGTFMLSIATAGAIDLWLCG